MCFQMLQCELERVSLAAYWTNRGGTRLGNLIIFALFLNLFCWHCGLNFLCEGFFFFSLINLENSKRDLYLFRRVCLKNYWGYLKQFDILWNWIEICTKHLQKAEVKKSKAWPRNVIFKTANLSLLSRFEPRDQYIWPHFFTGHQNQS